MQSQVNDNFKKILPFWDTLTKTSQQSIISSARFVKAPKETIIPNSQIDGMIIMKHGRLCVYMLAENGREMTLFHLNAEDLCIVTAQELFPFHEVDIHIQAEIDTEFFVLPANTINELIAKHSSVANHLFKLTAAAYESTVHAIQRNFFFDFSTRLALFLLEEKQTTLRSILYITHESIARHVGSSREVVSRELKKLAATGAIETSRGRIIIRDAEKLESFANRRDF